MNLYEFKGQKLLQFLHMLWDNKQIRYGIILIIIVAPIVKNIYLFFPENGFGEYLIDNQWIKVVNFIESYHLEPEKRYSWYWMTIYYYLWIAGHPAAICIIIFGTFLLFPKKYAPAYILAAPLGYYAAFTIQMMFIVDSLKSFHTLNVALIVMFTALGLVFFYLTDKLAFDINHEYRASEARIIGLVNLKGYSWEEKEELIQKEIGRLKSKEAKEFIIKRSA